MKFYFDNSNQLPMIHKRFAFVETYQLHSSYYIIKKTYFDTLIFVQVILGLTSNQLINPLLKSYLR
jgi:hypothetical protein